MSSYGLKPAIVVLGLTGVLTFFFVKTNEFDPKKTHETVLQIQNISHQDALIDQYILELQIGRLANYDALAGLTRAIKRNLDQLKSPESGLYQVLGAEIDGAFVQIEQQFSQKLALTERFKSHNGVLKNSLYFLPTAIERYEETTSDTAHHSETHELLHEVILDNASISENSLMRAHSLIEQFEDSGEASLEMIATHASTILEQGAALEQVVDELFKLPTAQSLETLYKLYTAHDEEMTNSVSRYRTAMYSLALLLLLYVGYLFFTLRRTMERLEDTHSEVAFKNAALDEHAIVMSLDSNGIVSYVNDKFEQISLYAKEEVIGYHWTAAIFLTNTGPRAEEIRNALSAGHPWSGELQSSRKDGSPYWVEATVVPFMDKQNTPARFVALLTDITERKLYEDRIYNLAHFDSLTGLPNRTLFLDKLETAIQRSVDSENKLAVLFIDLDNFKMINDTMGHASGDELLKIFGNHLQGCIGESDTVSRLGGDEFTILLSGISSTQDVERIVERIMSITQRGVTLGHKDISISGSIGISMFPDDAADVDSLLKNADIAMYEAKSDGRNTYRIFSEEFSVAELERHSLENELRRAISDQQFVLYYQPQMCSRTGVVRGVEALIRWKHPEKGMIPPDRFVPILEDTGLIVEVGLWVLSEACSQLVKIKEAGFNLTMSVNVSACQVRDETLVEQINELLSSLSLQPEEIELELTESSFLQNEDTSASVLEKLSEAGVSLSLDDFGTGYSSLSYLKKLPIDILKIDKSFIQALPDDKEDLAIARTILDMARNLDLKVVAEGVETAEQVAFLRDSQCDYLQGYFFSKPLLADALLQMLSDNRSALDKPIVNITDLRKAS